jgi:F5/8 type C domain
MNSDLNTLANLASLKTFNLLENGIDLSSINTQLADIIQNLENISTQELTSIILQIAETQTLLINQTSLLNQKFTSVDANLLKIENLIKNLSSYSGEYLNLLANQLSAGDWAGGHPVNLYQIVDSDENSYSDWGFGYGGGNKGWIKIDLGQAYQAIFEIKTDVALSVPYGANTINFYIESSFDNTTWTSLHSKTVTMTSNGEIQELSKQFNARYLRWGLLDIGNGAGKMRTAYLRVKL